ncbi:MAG: SocA family protein [Methanobrevibacter sp.]|jgi:uncharacterized phage-associated protein|nr:SocA family protein [Candidatus Methanoflexus mossambicus]
MEITLNKEKFEEMVYYIIYKCQNKPSFGKTVLFKLLYFADFDYYELNEKSISGETYQKFDYGPIPKHFDLIKNNLIQDKKIQEFSVPLFDDGKAYIFRYKSLKPPITNLISAKELERINITIDKLSDMNSGEISDYSHEDMPWRASQKNQDIDYNFVFYRDDPYVIRDIEW